LKNDIFEKMPNFSENDLYVSTSGNDGWSGKLAEANADKTDGPLATIAKARDLVRERKISGRLSEPVTVWIRGGRYFLSEPIVFEPEDSAPVMYAAYPGEQPIIDGGIPIKGWRVEEKGTSKLWVADVPEGVEGKWYFRQLFVNGERHLRPRLPKKGFYWMEDVPGTTLDGWDGSNTFQCASGDIQNWRNLTDVEVVVLHYWVEERMPIVSFDEKTRMVKSSRKSAYALKDDAVHTRNILQYAKYYLDNVFEALTEPGEWYLDRTVEKVYYIPQPGEDPDRTEVFAPRAEQLLKIVGKPEEEQYVEFLRFKGLTFQHTEWHQPSGGGELFGRPGIDFAAAPQAACNIPGVIHLEGARYCAVEDCRIEHVGWYGIVLGDGCVANRIVGNEIFDVGAGGVKLNGSDAKGPLSRRTGNNVVTDNHIHSGGRVFHSAVGILSMHSFGNVLSHNHIHDLYYTGISCGWVWGYGENVSKNNRIEKNYIHDLGHGLLSDMGGIYILGVQPGTVIRGNVIHDVEKCSYGGWGIYLDQGSSHILVEGNICYNMSSNGFSKHYGLENIVRNNIFAFGREGQINQSKAETHIAFSFEKNIVITDNQPLFLGSYTGQLEKHNFLSDLNLFWDISGKPLISGNGKRGADANWVLYQTFTVDEWKKLGYDLHSIIADPLFRDLNQSGFTLLEDSPAFALGFHQIDVSDVGPRPKDKKTRIENSE